MIGVLLAAFLAFSAVAHAQTPATPIIEIPAPDVTQELELNDGSSVIGRVESIAGGRWVFRSTAGVEMSVEVTAVRSLKPFTGRIVNGELWREDPNTTRLFFGPTGRSLKRGEAYFRVYEVVLPFGRDHRSPVDRRRNAAHFRRLRTPGLGDAKISGRQPRLELGGDRSSSR